MRVCSTALLLVFTLLIQTAIAGDIYWEDEDDSLNEFLEVKEPDSGLISHLRRLKRQLVSTLTDTTEDPVEYESATSDENGNDVDDDETPIEGSGTLRRDPDNREKTLRVTFVVMEPFQNEYSDRDSEQFQNISIGLADAVNNLFDTVPGTQRASLVRIQSRLSDEFSCKVTMDIITSGFDDTKELARILQDHIRQRRQLGIFTVDENEFLSTDIVDPGTTNLECAADEVKCDDNHCIAGWAWCNGSPDCPDGSDEVSCPDQDSEGEDQINEVDQQTSTPKSDNDDLDTFSVAPNEDNELIPETTTPRTERGDGDEGDDITSSDTENEVIPETTTAQIDSCAAYEFRCDNTRCVHRRRQCDRQQDCDDGSDEADCPPETCGADDFRCFDGRCIESARVCDRVADCSSQEDEQNCECRPDEFRCQSDGYCIESRKRCDGVSHCSDNSDEVNCATEYFRCRNGKILAQSKRCNRKYDCDPGDYSDEQNCREPRCPDDSFACTVDSRMGCARRCDGRQECDNGEDELECTECSHQCDGRCLEDHLICNGVPDCSDSSDEMSCPSCDSLDDFRCANGECINIAHRCNGLNDCSDFSDEKDCNNTLPSTDQCNDNQFRCQDGSCIDIQFSCDGNFDCLDNSDEDNCPCKENEWQCTTGQCVPFQARCDGTVDCTDVSDEQDCVTTTWIPPIQPQTTTRAPIVTIPPSVYAPTTRYPIRDPYEPSTRLPNLYPTTFRPGLDFPSGGSSGSGRDYTSLNLKTYPESQTIRNGGDVVFQCRDEGPLRAPVRWIKEGGRPFKPGTVDRKGRLEMTKVTVSDSGVYICQAPAYAGYPGSESRVTLVVESASQVPRLPFTPCNFSEATCGNGQCIPKSAVCDGKPDCDDRSDEDSCNLNGQCEPNQFVCDNKKCVLKTWLCDSEDDCGDGSDERDCRAEPGQACSAVEFACSSNQQCIPKSYHCDGHFDCQDNSDEIGCAPVHVKRPPAPANVRLNPGESLVLVCEAVGVPMPLISWRLNWGHVPPKCTSTSIDGVGTLTCNNMQPEDSGAYSCEAINRSGTTFAAPDSIVYVNKTDVCPTGFFNSEARSQNECIRCFCFGESNVCRSADLFTYNMPTPLGEGGTRLIGVTQTYTGDVQISSQPITDQFYYQSMRNGATVTKLDLASWYKSPDVQPFLTLPETYNGNQLTSYGGHIRYNLSPHSTRYSTDSTPDIIIKGKYQSLIYKHGGEISRGSYIEARLTPGNWMKPSSRGPERASREDIMMALDNIEMILLRAGINNAGVNITDFAMESAQHINVGLGAASLVEECTCPPGYEGLSCQKCAANYVRVKNGPWLGDCVPKRTCPPGTYGDPNSGYECKPCPCPLTNTGNRFATSCSIGSNGEVTCDCFAGYEGPQCAYCAAGYIGNPLVPGDSCKPKPTDNCNPDGTSAVRPPDDCICKDNVEGRFCDQCKNGSFYLSQDFRQGCALCFCSAVSQQCTSSTNLRRRAITVSFNVPNVVNQVKVYSSVPSSSAGAIRYNAPVETKLQPTLLRGEVNLPSVDRSRPAIYYWSLPSSYAGDKVTSYGGYLNYTINNVSPYGTRNNAADIQLISDVTFHYFGNFEPNSDGTITASVQLLEKGWQRPDGKEVSREYFLLALSHLKTILIKATYNTNDVSPISTASLEIAESNGNGPLALHVEQCVCPDGYIGTSCENCAPGYTRSMERGFYLKLCEPCECNGHSTMCHPETRECYDCADNTDGPSCENCKPGYVRDAYGNCVYESSTSPSCYCDPRGAEGPCDNSGYCRCKQNVEGESCDRCRAGTFGLDSDNPLGCHSCYCSGATTECHEATHYSRIQLAAPVFGDKVGYTLMDLQGSVVINDQFVSVPIESELRYVFSKPPNQDLYWSLPVFPGNRVLSYGGTLMLTQSFETGGIPDQGNAVVILVGNARSISWTSPNSIPSGTAVSYQVPMQESGWYLLNTPTPASREDFMYILQDLKRVLVKATLSPNVASSAIADVSLDTASEIYSTGSRPAKGVEICMCPKGYSGTSCETCRSGYYKEPTGLCKQCNCNGHDCQLGAYREVVCNCRPPYTGPNCSTVGGENKNETSLPPPAQSTVSIKIVNSTQIRIREVGSTVRFICEAQSLYTHNALRVNWTKVDGYLPLERTYLDARTGELLITNLQVTDSGQYICQTSDGISTGQAIATLKVPGNPMTLPIVAIRPSSTDYYEGDRIELECQVSGNPAPSITWQRASNKPVYRASQYDTFFIIDNALEEDSGEYRCIASNSMGSSDKSVVITVRARPSRPVREKLTVSANAANLTEGQSTRIVCTGTANVPAGTIEWIRQDGAQLLENVRSDNGVLYIDRATTENQGIYVCHSISTEIGPVPIVVTIIPLNPPSPGEASNITVSEKSLRLHAGGSGSVECNPTGNPLPLIKWTKYQGNFGSGVSQRYNSLLVSNAQPSDEGYYVCEGSVRDEAIGIIYVYVAVEKREPPRVSVWPQGEQAVALGSPFVLMCRLLAGDPEPVVTWERAGGRSLAPHAQLMPNHELNFEKVDVNDEGEYICTATNEAGSDRSSAVIKVRSPPEIFITPSDYVEAVRGDSVTIECRARGYPEPMVSIKTSPDMREVVPPSRGMAVLRIPSVSERDDGMYVCTASSAAATIDQQINIRVDRGDGGLGDFEGSGEVDINVDLPVYENRPSNSIAIEGRDARLSCNGSTDFDVAWRKDNGRLKYNVEARGIELIIKNATKSDSGVYECLLKSRQTGEVQQVTTIRLLVMAVPRISLRPATQVVQPGQSPTVECVVTGDDIRDITWKPVNRQPSSRIEIRGSTLIFRQIEVEDAGQYECFAQNPIANASAVAEVIVSEESGGRATESHDNEQTAYVGAAVQLSCNVTRPSTRIRWSKDGTVLPRSARQNDDGSLFIRIAQKSDSGRYICIIYDQYGRKTSNYINLHIEGPRNNGELVSIEQPKRQYIVGENVEVKCRTISRDIRVHWERYGTNQYVVSRTYGDGALLILQGVQEADAGLYRCIGNSPYGDTSYDDFNLVVVPIANNQLIPAESQPQAYTARLWDSVRLPCSHNLEQPVNIEWTKEYSHLPTNVRTNEPVLDLDSVSETDAGTYICRVSNNRAAVETRAILRVTGIVPRFNGDSWLALPMIKDAYMQFDIEISFKPSDNNGLVLYNGQNLDRSGDYLALQLIDGVPTFVFETGSGPVIVSGDRPLSLNTWHTIRISRTNSKVSMDVDNKGPFTSESSQQWDVLDLKQPLYIGGVPDPNQLPADLAGASGFIGCVSMLILGREEINMMADTTSQNNLKECDSCVPNVCLHGGVCQEARNERGYVCLCPAGYAGLRCDRTGEACRPGLCGPGRCTDTADGYKCACPVTFTGKNCEQKQNIEYPAFTGSAFLAIRLPRTSRRYFRMSMKIKATPPVIDGIIMYCKARGGGYTALSVHNGKLEFRFDLGDGRPVVLTSNKTLDVNEWTDVHVARVGADVSMKINMIDTYEQKLASNKTDVILDSPMYVGGVDESITLDNSTGVIGGFSGCIKEVRLNQGDQLDIVNASIQSANIQECPNDVRGDIPEVYSVCSLCRNDGRCTSLDATACTCPPGFSGTYCENRSSYRTPYIDPCAARPCRNGGICKLDRSSKMNYTCDCTLGFAGANCQMPLELLESVGFNGNGYLELPGNMLSYEDLGREPAVMALAINTNYDGVLLYHHEAQAPPNSGDYVLIRIENGVVVMEWDMGSGLNEVRIENVQVTDGDRHEIIAKLLTDSRAYLSVDGTTKIAQSNGFANVMSADSNVYIGGIPDRLNYNRYPGLVGCIEQVELMDMDRGIKLGRSAVAGRNTQRCRE